MPPGPLISKTGWRTMPRWRCSASVACTCWRVVRSLRAGSKRSLVEARQRGGELLHPSYQRVATATRDFPLPLEEQLVHLPELALQPGAGGGLSSTDTALAKVEHGTEDKLHLPLAHVFIYDDRFYRYDVAGTEWSQEVRVVGQRDRRLGRA